MTRSLRSAAVYCSTRSRRNGDRHRVMLLTATRRQRRSPRASAIRARRPPEGVGEEKHHGEGQQPPGRHSVASEECVNARARTTPAATTQSSRTRKSHQKAAKARRRLTLPSPQAGQQDAPLPRSSVNDEWREVTLCRVRLLSASPSCCGLELLRNCRTHDTCASAFRPRSQAR